MQIYFSRPKCIDILNKIINSTLTIKNFANSVDSGQTAPVGAF